MKRVISIFMGINWLLIAKTVLYTIVFCVLVNAALFLLFGCAHTSEVKVIPNFHHVIGSVYRSALPATLDEWKLLKDRLGPGAIVLKLNCETEGSDDYGRGLGFDVRNLCMEPRADHVAFSTMVKGAFTEPSPELVTEITRILTQECTKKACLIHCVHGKDRTGLVSAMTLVLLADETKDYAISVSKTLGMRPFPGLLRFFRMWVPKRL